ncbi:MAG TPA: regulatory iron-sulfur-containing complex subunit RicT [Pirellulaceae bacterium]|nr:regulatory iron-sulfur-containing complex subunit RicT [Pirellulaceae bacterium]HMO93225.1 regulatory iron-sulfur-containing complex subunit RicT [Pirellulaceae bacterium]HMP70056.1 regulatory iron-sulfur-containing complex subunit RicT [Pirellulaceae bacterium]
MANFVCRYGAVRSLGVFSAKPNELYKRGNAVIVRTNRGLETAQVLCEAREDVLSDLDSTPVGNILREMTVEDLNEYRHLQAKRKDRIDVCQRLIREANLDLKLIDIEHLFGGERLIIYFLAEQRIDFRELVKSLAAEFQTRIEMRQIGVRDEAKFLADYGDCGKPVCCNTHLTSMPPVSMKMAKLQKATLDPTKISGRCGRLKCCLRYEFDHYEDIHTRMPPIGAQIVTNSGHAKVINQEILAQQLLVETEDNRRILIGLDDVLTVVQKNGLSERENADYNLD